jgi:signal transduction histidine kinase
MKLSLTIVLAFLLAIGMMLINFVMIMLWQRDLVEHEIAKAHIVLEQVKSIENVKDNKERIARLLHSVFPKESRGGILFQIGTEEIFLPEEFPLASALTSIKSNVEAGADEFVRVDSSLWGGRGLARQALFIIVSQETQNEGKRVVAIARSLISVYSKLWMSEKSILIYILINILLLTVVGFYRFTQVVVKPIDRLVGLADQYQDDEHHLFVADNSGNEYSKLATSLNSMLSRIKQDRLILQENVSQLAAANKLLKRNQQEMIRTEKLASVGRMAAGLAHEIGNPLGVVQGYLGLLGREGGSVSAEELDYIKRAEDELHRVNSLIRQMLDFARVSQGAPEKFSVHDLLLSVVEMVKVQSSFKYITISNVLNAEQDIVFADQDQLRQVFINCLINSSDAISASQRKENGLISVITCLSSGDSEADQVGYICVGICDNGTGISEEHQSVVFDPFFTTKEPGKGTGLGLSVSHAIVEGMKGRMSIINNSGKGVTVEVFLPLVS